MFLSYIPLSGFLAHEQVIIVLSNALVMHLHDGIEKWNMKSDADNQWAESILLMLPIFPLGFLTHTFQFQQVENLQRRVSTEQYI